MSFPLVAGAAGGGDSFLASSAFFLTASSRLTPYIPASLAQNHMIAAVFLAMTSRSQRSFTLISSDSSFALLIISMAAIVSWPGPDSSSSLHPLDACISRSWIVISLLLEGECVAVVADEEFRLGLVDVAPRAGMPVEPAAMVVEFLCVADVLERVVRVWSHEPSDPLDGSGG